MVNRATVSDHFSFKRERAYTGKVQYAHDESGSITTDFGPWLRGEVKAIASRDGADGLVESGLFAHVAADTPTGVPQSVKDVYQPAKKDAKQKKAEPKAAEPKTGDVSTATDPKPGTATVTDPADNGTKQDGGQPATADSK